MAKKEAPCGGSALWHVGIDEFPMNDENQAAYRVATSEFKADKAEPLDWWFADRAAADQARMVLELHGFTVYGPDHVTFE